MLLLDPQPRDMRAKEALVRSNVDLCSAALCWVAALASCGDTVARPLYSAGESIRVDAGSPAKPCFTDQPLVLATTTPSNVSRPGALYAAAPIEPYVPRPVTARLTTTAGAPVGGCDVTWTPAPASGWVFPIAASTDADGRVDAWWTAGPDAAQALRVSVSDGKGGGASMIMSGTTEPRGSRATRVYLQYPVDAFDAYSVEVIPEPAPQESTFGALWTLPCGAGLTSDPSGDGGPPVLRAFAFCWDSDMEATAVLDPSGSSCHPIGTAGTLQGTWCSQLYPWKAGEPYRIDLETRHALAGHTDYVFYVTTVASGERTKLVELRFGGGDRPSAAFSYLQGDAIAASCLETEQLSALFRNVTQIDNGLSTNLRAATFTRDYDAESNVICANYDYGTSDGAFLLSTGGMRVGPPRPPGWPAPTITLP